ncbi:Hypothetical predicted protein [Pelobates cultripes]|uniref:Uncharacterized protein n=1 Tax=Pelobates cultripes TaxID=61616 RepID=A0AAD1RAX4_PELCU|nr:Hypothetical predicted protein [Pelobates cultripes]
MAAELDGYSDSSEDLLTVRPPQSEMNSGDTGPVMTTMLKARLGDLQKALQADVAQLCADLTSLVGCIDAAEATSIRHLQVR